MEKFETYRLKRLWLLVPGAAALCADLGGEREPVTDRGVVLAGRLPVAVVGVGFLPSLAPFSVAQWVVVATLAFCIGWLGFYLVAFVRGRGRRRFVLWRALTTMLAVLSVAYCIFALMCGLNYYRHTFAEDAGFELRESSTAELTALCENLAANMNETRAEVTAAAGATKESGANGGDATTGAEGTARTRYRDGRDSRRVRRIPRRLLDLPPTRPSRTWRPWPSAIRRSPVRCTPLPSPCSSRS
ncbi:MAG: DUF3810 family protein [Adlercreutzia equolifaciens]